MQAQFSLFRLNRKIPIESSDRPFSSFRRWARLGAYPLDWASDPGDGTRSFGEK
jgi:hypothetical protein